MSLPDSFQSGGSQIEYVTEDDGSVSVRPIRENQNRPLQRYFPSDLAELYADGNLKRFQDNGNKAYKKIIGLAEKYLQRYEKAEGTGLYLYSETPGSGKTMLCCLLAAALSRKYNISSQAMTTIGLMNRVQETFSDDRKSVESITNPLKAVDVLVLDEIGAEKHSEFREDVMYDLINHRLNKAKPIFFTSNVKMDDLQYHNRIKSRIIEMSFRIPMPGVDMRTVIRKEKNAQIFERFRS